jgi:hypothetical protein
MKMKKSLKTIFPLQLILFIVLISSCRDYENINPGAIGTRQTLIYSYDSLNITATSEGNYINSVYYENSNNLMDSIRVDFTGETNIDTNNSCQMNIKVIDEDNNMEIGNYTYSSPSDINKSYQLGFKVSNIYRFIVYFNLSLEIRHIQYGNYFITMKNIKVWNIY